MTRAQESVLADFFDNCARKGLMAAFEPEERTKVDAFVRMWNIRPGDRVLEPGCGSGRFTEILAEAVGSTGEVFACDLSPEMIARAQSRRLPSQVAFARISARQVPRPNEWFDHILCLCVFPHFDDLEAILAEFDRLLKPAGHFWIHHFAGRDQLNHFHRDAGGPVVSHQLPDADGIRALLEKAGFRLVELIDEPGQYTLHAVRDASGA